MKVVKVVRGWGGRLDQAMRRIFFCMAIHSNAWWPMRLSMARPTACAEKLCRARSSLIFFTRIVEPVVHSRQRSRSVGQSRDEARQSKA